MRFGGNGALDVNVGGMGIVPGGGGAPRRERC